MNASDHPRNSSRSSIGTPSMSAIMIIGSGAATVSTKSTSTPSGIWSNRSAAICFTWSSSSLIARGVKA